MRARKWLLFISLLISVKPSLAATSAPSDKILLPSTIELAATEWCPYLCQLNEHKPGIVIDYLNYLARQLNTEFTFHFYPWSRAIQLVNSKSHHGLATAISTEAPNLLLTTVPTMTYRACFYVNRNATWRYENVSSIEKINLGYVADYGYGEPIDNYLEQHSSHKNLVKISGNAAISRLLKMLKSGRIDSFIADQQVTRWINRLSHLDNSIDNAGCLTPSPFFVAVNPSLNWSKVLLKQLDALLKKEENQRYLQQVILPNYQ